MTTVDILESTVQTGEERLLAELRTLRKTAREDRVQPPPVDALTFGQTVADQVASTMGSWSFIIIQSAILFVWIILNIAAFARHWDPYPFILLNLALSFQAAYAAPFIMMSQNRQQAVDRDEAESDHQINVKAELEIELLHQKVDQLREKEVTLLTNAISDLTQVVRATLLPPHTPHNPETGNRKPAPWFRVADNARLATSSLLGASWWMRCISRPSLTRRSARIEVRISGRRSPRALSTFSGPRI